MALPVAQSGLRAYQCFPLNHPLYMSGASLKDADVVLALDVDIPWHADSNPPPDSAWVAMTDVEPAKRRIPTMEFTADLRLTADALSVIEALDGRGARADHAGGSAALCTRARRNAPRLPPSAAPIWPRMRSRAPARRRSIRNGCRIASPRCSTTIASCSTRPSRRTSCTITSTSRSPAPISTIRRRAAAGRPGAAFGAKLAAPDKDVIAVSGDGFYMFGTPIHALWAARHYKAPFMAVVYQNRSYSTGTLRINSVYGAKDSYAAKADYDGGYFDPPIDFAKEAEAAGAYGENVTDSAQIEAGAAARAQGDPRGRPAGGDLGVARKAVAEGLN